MKRGWCPTVHAPMLSGDGLLVRVKPFGGRLPAAALHTFAAAVAEYGNGIVELTGRGNLQVRGVRDASAFATAMLLAGLADADPVREARRNVITVPPCDDALVAEAEAVLSETAGLAPKFAVAVSGREIRVGTTIVSTGEGLRIVLQRAQFVTAGFDPATREPTADCGTLMYLPFGQTDAETLTRLAATAPEVRTTPWRAFLSPVAVEGFAREPGTITACPGAPACSSATVPARQDAARLAALGLANLHVSGCSKGCAYPRPATTLVGREGRYDLVRHGLASANPDRVGLTLDEAIALI